MKIKTNSVRHEIGRDDNVICISKIERNEDPAQAGFIAQDDGAVWLDEDYCHVLRETGLVQFDEVMQFSGGRCHKKSPGREVQHLRVEGPAQSPLGIYLKRHRRRTLIARLRAICGLSPPPTPAHVEAVNIGRLVSAGIAVMRLLAYGEKNHSDGRMESFLITEELEGFVELPCYLKQKHFEERTRQSEKELNRLVCEIADIVGRFHRAGYNHRDLYCLHFFVKDRSPDGWDIRLIDLQRVQRRRWFRRRWIVKDLAQLAWSAPSAAISCKHKIAFLHAYFGVKKLEPRHRRWMRSILFKQRLMEWKLGNDN